MKVGVIGLGRMGSGIAQSLLRAGHEVSVYNRTPEKAQALVALGASAAGSIADACLGDAVITVLANDAAVESVVFAEAGILANLAGAIHISSSTISVSLAERLTAAHSHARQRFVSAPVFGRPDTAAAGQLVVAAAGAADAIQAASPLLDAMGRTTFIASDTPKVANLIKLSGNFLFASVIESLGEALALVEKAGVDRQKYLDFLTSTLFDLPVYKLYGGLIVREEFEPAAFEAQLGYKDIRLALAAADDLRVPMPLGGLLRDRFLTLLAHGGDHLDWSAIGALPARDAAEVTSSG